MGIRIDDTRLEAALNDIAKENNMTLAQLQQKKPQLKVFLMPISANKFVKKSQQVKLVMLKYVAVLIFFLKK